MQLEAQVCLFSDSALLRPYLTFTRVEEGGGYFGAGGDIWGVGLGQGGAGRR